MTPHVFARDERRAVWAKGVPSRADALLRPICRREGDAVFCSRCDGDGVTVKRAINGEPAQPTKCVRCGGEGLEP